MCSGFGVKHSGKFNCMNNKHVFMIAFVCIFWVQVLQASHQKTSIDGDVALAYNESISPLFRDVNGDTVIADSVGNNVEALMNGIIEDEITKVQSLLLQGLDPDTQDEDGFFPLDTAICLNRHQIVKLLYDHGANVDRQCDNRHSLLGYAIAVKYNEIVKILIERSNNIYYKDHNNETLLIIAAHVGNYEAVDILIDYYKRLHKDKIKTLVNMQDVDGFTPLMYLAFHGNYHCVRRLIYCGAKMHLSNNKGLTAYDIAQTKKHFDILGMLIDEGDHSYCCIS